MIKIKLICVDVTFQRMKMAAKELDFSSDVVRALLGNCVPKTPFPAPLNTSQADLAHLNTEQVRAVQLSASDTELLCLHGPPGTGKTTTIAAIIREHALSGTKVNLLLILLLLFLLLLLLGVSCVSL